MPLAGMAMIPSYSVAGAPLHKSSHHTCAIAASSARALLIFWVPRPHLEQLYRPADALMGTFRPCGQSSRERSPVVALAEGGEGLLRMPSAACSAATLPFLPAFSAVVHISTTRDRFTAEGEAAATAPAHAAEQCSMSRVLGLKKGRRQRAGRCCGGIERASVTTLRLFAPTGLGMPVRRRTHEQLRVVGHGALSPQDGGQQALQQVLGPRG